MNFPRVRLDFSNIRKVACGPGTSVGLDPAFGSP